MLKISMHKDLIEAGCDEAGRGCLAGPVFAAAVILPKKCKIEGLDDSKKLTENKRLLLREEIEKHAISYGVAKVDKEEIEKINILNASFKAMHLAIDKLQKRPELLLIDGNRFIPYDFIIHKTIVGGDGIYASIAAASILAKTYRDEYMQKLALKHPVYGWERNKGYATLEHRNAIREHGLTCHHRESFCKNFMH